MTEAVADAGQLGRFNLGKDMKHAAALVKDTGAKLHFLAQTYTEAVGKPSATGSCRLPPRLSPWLSFTYSRQLGHWDAAP